MGETVCKKIYFKQTKFTAREWSLDFSGYQINLQN